MSVTLIALTNAIPANPADDSGLLWLVHFDKDRDYNQGLIRDSHYDVDDYKEVNVGNWTYYNNFIEWLLATFPNMKPFEFSLQTYAINSDFCKQIYLALTENIHLLNEHKNQVEYHQTYLDIHAAFEFAGSNGLVIFE